MNNDLAAFVFIELVYATPEQAAEMADRLTSDEQPATAEGTRLVAGLTDAVDLQGELWNLGRHHVTIVGGVSE